MSNYWDDMKLAFSVDDTEAVWEALGLNGSMLHMLPYGWSLVETDSSGARCVAVFRVEGSISHIWSESYLVYSLLAYCQGQGPHPSALGFLF